MQVGLVARMTGNGLKIPAFKIFNSSTINRSFVQYRQADHKNGSMNLSICSSSFHTSTKSFITSSESSNPLPTSAPEKAEQEESSMEWDEYFQLKKNRRLRDRLLSYPAAFFSSGAMGSYLMTNIVLDPANNGLIMGLDPFIVFGAGSASSGLVAFLVAPLIGSLGYRLLKPKTYKEMIKKDADFYQRIVKYRVNMSVQPRSVSAPPDYFGEKILSRKDYRHWLRRQYDYKRQMAI